MTEAISIGVVIGSIIACSILSAKMYLLKKRYERLKKVLDDYLASLKKSNDEGEKFIQSLELEKYLTHRDNSRTRKEVK